MSDSKYLKPMLDNGSPRVFNVNVLTQRLSAKNPDVTTFFRNKPLNTTILIKDTATDGRSGSASVGTKLYFPFNVGNIYEGGRTMFIHEPKLQKAIIEHYGEGALDKTTLDEDMRILSLLDRIPSMDPFLMRDLFQRNKITINEEYFTISPEAWQEIEAFMLLRFEPLVKAAFPDAMESDDRARLLINKIWEAQDVEALGPLIAAFRLPQHEALDMFLSWRGIVYYAYQYQMTKPQCIDMMQWFSVAEASTVGMPAQEAKELKALLTQIRDQLRIEWQQVEGTIRQYEDAYDKMFKLRTSSAEFVKFLRNSSQLYWNLGSSVGKVNQGIYCWKVMTQRFNGGKIPWAQLQDVVKVLAKIFEADKKGASAKAW